MKFTPTKYMQITGTEVLVQVTSAAEAKAADRGLWPVCGGTDVPIGR